MTDPTVACIMLTRDRPEYARRAVECFRAQTYANKRLLIWNNGERLNREEFAGDDISLCEPLKQGVPVPRSIGVLRNEALDEFSFYGDVVIHFDDDDWSHSNRIAEQVALLQSSGADCVGYREVLFWRTGRPEGVHSLGLDRWQKQPCTEGSYLYINNDPRYCVGSSFCYWRKAWDARPFEDVMREEDGRWLKGVRSVGHTAIPYRGAFQGDEPRMICRVHAGNAKHYPLDELVQTCPSSWKRVPQWDTHCHEVMG